MYSPKLCQPARREPLPVFCCAYASAGDAAFGWGLERDDMGFQARGVSLSARSWPAIGGCINRWPALPPCFRPVIFRDRSWHVHLFSFIFAHVRSRLFVFCHADLRDICGTFSAARRPMALAVSRCTLSEMWPYVLATKAAVIPTYSPTFHSESPACSIQEQHVCRKTC